jgi:hypothetical protein
VPNHITNTVTFSGTEDDLKAIRAMMDTSKNADGTDNENGRAFDFNAVLPMPKSLEIECGSTTDVGWVPWGNRGPGGHPGRKGRCAPWAGSFDRRRCKQPAGVVPNPAGGEGERSQSRYPRRGGRAGASAPRR